MATAVGRIPSGRADTRFFAISAILMTLVMVAGFSIQAISGRSSFAAPPVVHAHAVIFFGWVMIYLAQNLLAASGNIALHRRLGWLAVLWIVPMLAAGFAVTLAMVQEGRVPFFFRPQHFLVFDPASLVFFSWIVAAAVALRRRSDWHRRLQLCAMTLLLGPGFGRLLPSPLLMPWSYDIIFAVQFVFPVAGMIADRRRDGRVHPAWIWGVGAGLLSYAVTQAITFSPLGDALYAAAVVGTPAANVPGLAYPAPPPGL
jgi:hypothetical protein